MLCGTSGPRSGPNRGGQPLRCFEELLHADSFVAPVRNISDQGVNADLQVPVRRRFYLVRINLPERVMRRM